MDLWDHQQQTVSFSEVTPRVFDTSDPGTGKSRAHLEIFNKRREKGLTSKLLVICPRTLMKAAWDNDAKRFYPHLTTSLAFAYTREQAFDQDADIYIVNSDGVKYLSAKPDTWIKAKFGADPSLIIDESTSFKNHTAQRTKSMFKLAKLFHYRSLLTATPINKSVLELWSQLYILDDGTHLGPSFYAFRNAVQNSETRYSHTEWTDKPGAREAVAKLLEDVTIRHDFDTVMTSVPEMTTRTIEVDLSPQLMSLYEELKERSIVELETGEVTAINAAVLANKLLQMASGAVYLQGAKHSFLDGLRYELIADLIEERECSVVFFSWTHQYKCISHALEKRKVPFASITAATMDNARGQIVEDFQAGKYRALLLHPRTGAHGLTLTRARTVIWASPRYEADLMKQGIFRIRRGGQDKPTETIRIAAKDTIEPYVYERLDSSTSQLEDLLTMLRR